jgi:hypothetical protein
MNFVGMAQKPAKALPTLKRGDARAGTSGVLPRLKLLKNRAVKLKNGCGTNPASINPHKSDFSIVLAKN